MAVVEITEEKTYDNKNENEGVNIWRIICICATFLWKLIEVCVITSITAIGTKWPTANQFIADYPTLLVFLIFPAAILQYWLNRRPSNYARPPVNFIFLTAGFLFFSIHVPIIYPTLKPSVAIWAGVTTALTYLSYMLYLQLAKEKIPLRGLGFRLLGLVVPTAALIISQLSYVILYPSGTFDGISYGDYLINITASMLISLLTSYDNIIYAENCGSSDAELKSNLVGQIEFLNEKLSKQREDLEATESRIDEMETIATQFGINVVWIVYCHKLQLFS